MAFKVKGDWWIGRMLSALWVRLRGSTSGTVTVKASNITTDYDLVLPPAQGSSNQTLINDGSGNLSWGTQSGYRQEEFTLTLTDINNKYVLLATAPQTRANTKLTVWQGPEQRYFYDYVITDDNSGKRLSWSGKTLDGQLSENDVLIVFHD